MIIRNKATLMLALILVTACRNNQHVQSDLQRENLYGKVKSITEIEYSAHRKFDAIEKYQVKNKSIKRFDRGGMLLEHEAYDSDGNLTWKQVNTIDNSGRLKLQSGYDEFGKIDYEWHFVYDDNGFLIERIENDFRELPTTTTKTIYENDESGFLIAEYEIDKSNSKSESWKYINNENGQMIEKSFNNLRHVYEYDDRGNIVSWTAYNPEKNEREVWAIYVYDEYHNLVEAKEESAYFGARPPMTYRYTYDTYNNWISRVSGSVYPVLVEREIEYYD